MDFINELPFKVGQEAESKSFKPGFRGAWFRCKILGISKAKGKVGFSLDFFDYPDEKVTWTQLYQKPPYNTKSSRKERKMELMVRPAFPSMCHESEIPVRAPSSVAVVLHDSWKLGDLIDWLSDGCYWSGRITKLLGDGKVQVQLLQPPFGEGQSYEVFTKDLRPSLHWSPEHGWTVPLSSEREREGCPPCTSLVQPCIEGESRTNKYRLLKLLEKTAVIPFPTESSLNRSNASVLCSNDEENKEKGPQVEVSLNANLETPPNSSNVYCGMSPSPTEHPYSSKDTEHEMDTVHSRQETSDPLDGAEHTMDIDLVSISLPSPSGVQCTMMELSEQISESRDRAKPDMNCMFEASSSHNGAKDTSRTMNKVSSIKDRHRSEGTLKRMRNSGFRFPSAVAPSDSIESSILELEELANKMRWLKGLVKVGLRWSNSMKPSWKLSPKLHDQR